VFKIKKNDKSISGFYFFQKITFLFTFFETDRLTDNSLDTNEFTKTLLLDQKYSKNEEENISIENFDELVPNTINEDEPTPLLIDKLNSKDIPISNGDTNRLLIIEEKNLEIGKNNDVLAENSINEQIATEKNTKREPVLVVSIHSQFFVINSGLK
jgi:hypothetical protein